MERQVGGENLAPLSSGDHLADAAHCFGVAIGEVNREQPVVGAGRVHHRAGLGRVTAEGLLAEDGRAGFQGADRLLGVLGAGRGDHHPVGPQLEQLVEAGARCGARCEGAGLLRRRRKGIGHACGLHHPRLQHGLHAVAADPAGPQEADPGPQR